ncbi:hypothetical protein H4K35_04500 [Myroides sp. NP-2]|uniref:hypothetical protein n=1 Tax=Myroides sp. NP-2 TaxID=2759945 RepID=UPI0015FD209F|nr:hypothetical protein [Myroides sp. NP-2]MBB1149401.1 hypothetical protein [Myroides sp. NP-2]
MKKYNAGNFFKHTYCEWTEVPLTAIAQKTPNYKSEKGSCYFFSEVGIFRYANHWGRVANCRWKLISDRKANQGFCVGYASWSSFFPNDEKENNYVISVNFLLKEVTFKHYASLKDSDACRRNANDTAKRIVEIKKVLLADDWYKYITHPDQEEVRRYLINGLVNTNKSLLELKRNFLSSQ